MSWYASFWGRDHDIGEHTRLRDVRAPWLLDVDPHEIAPMWDSHDMGLPKGQRVAPMFEVVDGEVQALTQYGAVPLYRHMERVPVEHYPVRLDTIRSWSTWWNVQWASTPLGWLRCVRAGHDVVMLLGHEQSPYPYTSPPDDVDVTPAPAPTATPDTDSGCYAVACGAVVKVGKSATIRRRAKQMRVTNPYSTRIVALHGDMAVERDLWRELTRLGGIRVRGEWFAADRESVVDAFVSLGGVPVDIPITDTVEPRCSPVDWIRMSSATDRRT